MDLGHRRRGFRGGGSRRRPVLEFGEDLLRGKKLTKITYCYAMTVFHFDFVQPESRPIVVVRSPG